MFWQVGNYAYSWDRGVTLKNLPAGFPCRAGRNRTSDWAFGEPRYTGYFLSTYHTYKYPSLEQLRVEEEQEEATRE